MFGYNEVMTRMLKNLEETYLAPEASIQISRVVRFKRGLIHGILDSTDGRLSHTEVLRRVSEMDVVMHHDVTIENVDIAIERFLDMFRKIASHFPAAVVQDGEVMALIMVSQSSLRVE